MTQVIENGVKDLLIGEIGFAGGRDTLTSDFPLIENDVLDSLAIFELVGLIEDRFGLELDDEELVPGNFETIAAIARLISRKLPV